MREKEYRSRIQITYSLLMTIGFFILPSNIERVEGHRGGSKITGKGVLMYKRMRVRSRVRFPDFISFFSNIP